MFLEREQLELLIERLIEQNNYRDLAMLFISYENMEFDDIFYLSYTKDQRFYDNVFKVLTDWVKKKLFHKNWESMAYQGYMYVLDRMKVNVFTKRKNKLLHIDKDYLVSKMFIQLYTQMNNIFDSNRSNIFLESLAFNIDINTDFILGLLLNDIENTSNSTIKYILDLELLDYDAIRELIIAKGYHLTKEGIRDIFKSVYDNNNYLINAFRSFLRIYDLKLNKNFRSYIELRKEYKKDIRTINIIREIFIEFILPLVEYDISNFLLNSYEICKNEGDTLKTSVYKRYYSYICNIDRFEKGYDKKLLMNGHEENDILEENEYINMYNDGLINRYCSEVETLEGLDLFCRCFNINRFKLFHYGLDLDTIHYMLENIEFNDDSYWVIQSAIDKRTILYLFGKF